MWRSSGLHRGARWASSRRAGRGSEAGSRRGFSSSAQVVGVAGSMIVTPQPRVRWRRCRCGRRSGPAVRAVVDADDRADVATVPRLDTLADGDVVGGVVDAGKRRVGGQVTADDQVACVSTAVASRPTAQASDSRAWWRRAGSLRRAGRGCGRGVCGEALIVASSSSRGCWVPRLGVGWRGCGPASSASIVDLGCVTISQFDARPLT